MQRFVICKIPVCCTDKITHHLRNAVSALQDVEFITLELIDKAEKSGLELILENDRLRAKDILLNFCPRITNSVTSQIKIYFLSNGINQNIRVIIKRIVPDGENYLDWKIETVYVDHETWHKQDSRIKKIGNCNHIINANTDFEKILVERKNVFMSNNLNAISENEYKNSSLDWRKRYNATIVAPIKSKPDDEGGNVVYYGFLTADSMNSENQDLFSDDVESPVFNIMAHATDALAVFYIKHDDHTKALKNALVQCKGLLELQNI